MQVPATAALLPFWPQDNQGYNGAVASPLSSLDMNEDRFRAYLQQRTAVLGANELRVAWGLPDGSVASLLQLAILRNLIGHVPFSWGLARRWLRVCQGFARPCERVAVLEILDMVLERDAHHPAGSSQLQSRNDGGAECCECTSSSWRWFSPAVRGSPARTRRAPSAARGGRRHAQQSLADARERHRTAAELRLGGRTALGLASEYGNLEVLELLLEYGARPDVLDVYDRLPNDPTYAISDQVREFWAARSR